MRSIEFVLKGKGSDICLRLPKPIDIPEGYHASLGLKNFSMYNTIHNIKEGVNNCVKILSPCSTDWKTFKLESGAWELDTIAETLYSWIEHEWPQLKDVRKDFILTGEQATSKCVFIFKNAYGVDFNVEHSLCSVMGFRRSDRFVGRGVHKAPNIANIAGVTELLFNCNLVESSWLNTSHVPLLYSCVIDVPPGYRMFRDVQNVSYKKVNSPAIQIIHVWMSDENGRAVDIRDDSLVLTLSLNIVPSIASKNIKTDG